MQEMCGCRLLELLEGGESEPQGGSSADRDEGEHEEE